MTTIILPVPLPAVSTIHAARLAHWQLIMDELPLAGGMAEVSLYEAEPDQLPADGLWLGDVRVTDDPAALGRAARTETAELDIVIWVSRDGNDSLLVESRAWEIRDVLRAIEREHLHLDGAANLWAEPSRDVLHRGVAPAGGARCALLTHTLTVEVRS